MYFEKNVKGFYKKESVLLLMIDDIRLWHTWLLQYQYLTFSSKLKSDVQMELTYPQYYGLDYNFGHARSKIHYTGKLNVKFMIQARQSRKDHPDSHYAAAMFRYQKEYAILVKEHCNFLSTQS